MDAGLLAIRLVLAAVFAVAGAAKLLDRAGTRLALAGFGLPDRLAGPTATALPIGELVVALALLVPASAWWGALGALSLLVAFTAAVARSISRGERPDCRCFGQISAAPIGWSTLARNVALSLMAGSVVFLGLRRPALSAFGWLEPLAPSERVLAILGVTLIGIVAITAGMLGRVLVRQREVDERLDGIEERLEDVARGTAPAEAGPPDPGLPVGAPAPAIELPDLTGSAQTLVSLAPAGRAILLVFVSPACDPCAVLVPDIRQWHRQHRNRFVTVLVSTGSADANRSKFNALSADGVLIVLQSNREVADAYGSAWTPGAVLIGPTKRIASPIAHGDEAIRRLAAHAAAEPDVPYLGPSRAVEPAPALALPDLDGRTVDLRDYRGHDTLVLFWRPGCSYCQTLLSAIREWEAAPPAGAPRLLVVSSESIEANRALGLQAPIVLDDGFTTGGTFGVRGTPSAVLVDATGRIASTVAVGGPAVLALAGVAATSGAPAKHVATS